MAQITHGLRGILSHPRVYSAVQNLLGAESVRKEFVENQVRPTPGMRVLDIGCGPGDVLAYMQSVDYWGFDTSQEYIAHAQSVYGGRAKFFCKELHAADLRDLPPFDVVLAMGLLHHLDNDIAKSLINMAAQALRPGGRLLTFDPCFEPDQNFLARYLIKRDRGQNVRTRQEYEDLVKPSFDSYKISVRHRLWVPYTRCFMECTRVL
jgi:SAM-dependent methyltransferase